MYEVRVIDNEGFCAVWSEVQEIFFKCDGEAIIKLNNKDSFHRINMERIRHIKIVRKKVIK